MSSKQAPGGYSSAELAALIGCLRSEIEALARAHRWPRVDGRDGMTVAIDIATARRATERAAGVFTEANSYAIA